MNAGCKKKEAGRERKEGQCICFFGLLLPVTAGRVLYLPWGPSQSISFCMEPGMSQETSPQFLCRSTFFPSFLLLLPPTRERAGRLHGAGSLTDYRGWSPHCIVASFLLCICLYLVPSKGPLRAALTASSQDSPQSRRSERLGRVGGRKCSFLCGSELTFLSMWIRPVQIVQFVVAAS